MHMSKYFVCCEQCFEAIGKRNTRAAKLWMDLCALHLAKGEVIPLHMSDFPELRALETLGFLVSTDRDDSLNVKLKGHLQSTSGENFFCIEVAHHA